MSDANDRIDKFLWSIRVFKTRADATEACKKGKVLINDIQVKPSRTVKSGEVIHVKKMPVLYSYEVLEPLQKRVGAKLVEKYAKDITPREELDKLNMQDDFYIKRDKGTGRPTKKERRIIDKLQGN